MCEILEKLDETFLKKCFWNDNRNEDIFATTFANFICSLKYLSKNDYFFCRSYFPPEKCKILLLSLAFIFEEHLVFELENYSKNEKTIFENNLLVIIDLLRKLRYDGVLIAPREIKI